MCVLLHLIKLHIRHACLGLHVVVSSNERTTRIWPFSCGFDCTTIMVYAGFRLLFGKIIVL